MVTAFALCDRSSHGSFGTPGMSVRSTVPLLPRNGSAHWCEGLGGGARDEGATSGRTPCVRDSIASVPAPFRRSRRPDAPAAPGDHRQSSGLRFVLGQVVGPIALMGATTAAGPIASVAGLVSPLHWSIPCKRRRFDEPTKGLTPGSKGRVELTRSLTQLIPSMA